LIDAYPTQARGGKYCVPLETELEDQILSGPLSLSNRWLTAIGSFQYPWTIILFSVFSTIFWGYISLYCSRPGHLKIIVFCCHIFALLLFSLFSLFFLLGCLAIIIPEDYGEAYKKANPIFSYYSHWYAPFISFLIGIVLFLLSCDIFFGMSKLKDHLQRAAELIGAVREMLSVMPMVLVQPLIEAILKYIVAMHMVYGFMWLVSAGHLNTHRIVINGSYFVGYSRNFVYDHSDVFLIILYVISCVWVMEIMSAFSQLVISSQVVEYYYTEKEDDKKKVPGDTLWKVTKNALQYHFGTACLGAFFALIFRVQRISHELHEEHQGKYRDDINKDDDEVQKSGFSRSVLGRCCLFCGVEVSKMGRFILHKVAFLCCFPFTLLFKSVPFFDQDWYDTYTKDAYTDTYIRKTDYLQAAEHARITILSHKVTASLGGACNSLAWALIFGIASLSSGITLFMMLKFPAFADPASQSFIADPIMITLLDFILCCYISYGFMNVFEHAADSLLFCYAFNRRQDRHSVSHYIPDSIRCIVGWDDTLEQEVYYNTKTNPLMYLKTWLTKKGRHGHRPGLLESMMTNFNEHPHETQSLIEE